MKLPKYLYRPDDKERFVLLKDGKYVLEAAYDPKHLNHEFAYNQLIALNFVELHADAQMAKLKDFGAKTAIVIGSGLSNFMNGVKVEFNIPFSNLELQQPSVQGHEGIISACTLKGAKLLVVQGRIHLYEGHSATKVTEVIQILANVGITQVILTNAAGALNKKFALGQWMLISDHINMTAQTPLEGPKFIDMSDVYSKTKRPSIKRAASKLNITMYEGVYAGMLGPQYETPAEIKMLQRMGADAVGMSTIMEAIKAKELGMDVLALSYLSNWGTGMNKDAISHEDVLSSGDKPAKELQELLKLTLSKLGTNKSININRNTNDS